MAELIDTHKLWYDKPAETWEEALPLGNGRLGGMVFGKVSCERIQLNEDSIWYGGPSDRNNPDALPNLPKIRQLILDGRIKEAEELAVYALSGIPEGQRHYEPLGDLYLFFAGEKGLVSEYRRELELSTATARTEFVLNGVRYRREAFASYPHQAMVIRLTADTPGAISFHTQLSRGTVPWNDEPFSTYKFRYNGGFNAYVDKSRAAGPDCTVMCGQCGGQGAVSFCGAVKAVAEGGSVRTMGNSILVEHADAVTLFLTASTTFREENPEETCLCRLEELAKIPCEELRKAHLDDYRALFDRVRLDICTEQDAGLEDLPTDARLERLRDGGGDAGLVNLFFQYGRYLLIASSRPGSLPANLQGIWNQQMLPIWDSKYTININAQMNYWPAESCNLSECHLPLFDLLERMREPGRVTARSMYGCGGFMAHHNTDIWADTAPQDVCLSSTYWVMGAAWLCLHLWEHYQYTRDTAFLKNAYGTMREAAEFLLDYLIEDENGRLVTCPTLSPENEYRLPSGETGVLCVGASMDSQIIRELFNACVEAAGLLETDEQFRKRLEDALHKVPEIAVGKYGQIQEWAEDYEEIDPGHRHVSQLFALYPGSQISPHATPEWAEAARKTLERRLSNGGGHTGWSRAWIINLWARLGDGEQAWQNILELLRKSTQPNLFDTHPPFQIDGNFGCTAGIAEMLLQSQEGELNLLPALPQAWKDGSVRGLVARGGLEVDLEWNGHRLADVGIRASQSGDVRLRYGEQTRTVTVEAGKDARFDGNLLKRE